MEYTEYQCVECDKKVTVPASRKEAPECCKKPMKRVPLDVCTRPCRPNMRATWISTNPVTTGAQGHVKRSNQKIAGRLIKYIPPGHAYFN